MLGKLKAMIAAKQSGVQIQDEGINQGVKGQASVYNFTGSGVTASVSGNTATINVAAAGAVMESDYTPAHSILVQQSGTGSPSALQVSNNTLIGRLSGGGSNIADLTGAEATTLLEVFTSLLKGVVPASGGGTVNFLRADGTWAAPSGISAAEYYARQTQYFYGDNL